MAIATKKPAAVAAKPAVAPKAAPVAASSVGELHEATMTVSTTVLENGTIKGVPVESEQKEIKVFATAPAKASIMLTVSKNLGNYESVKFSVGVSMPCYVEEFDNASAQAIDKAKSLMDEVVAAFDPSAFVSGGVVVDGNADLAETGAEATAGEGEAEAGGDLTPDWALTASREEIIQVIADNSLELDPEDYPDDDDLRTMFNATVFPEDGAEGEAAADDEAEQEPLTQEALEAASTDDLKEVYTAWEMGAFPKYTNAASEKIARKNAIKKILETQEASAAA